MLIYLFFTGLLKSHLLPHFHIWVLPLWHKVNIPGLFRRCLIFFSVINVVSFQMILQLMVNDPWSVWLQVRVNILCLNNCNGSLHSGLKFQRITSEEPFSGHIRLAYGFCQDRAYRYSDMHLSPSWQSLSNFYRNRCLYLECLQRSDVRNRLAFIVVINGLLRGYFFKKKKRHSLCIHQRLVLRLVVNTQVWRCSGHLSKFFFSKNELILKFHLPWIFEVSPCKGRECWYEK